MFLWYSRTYNLIDYLTPKENVMLEIKPEELLTAVKFEGRLESKSLQLSEDNSKEVAIARL